MKVKDPSFYIREMIRQFQMPGTDCITERMFSPGKNAPWDSGVFISCGQSEKFYTDIFQFWVRALFCFFENTLDNSTLVSVAPFVACRQIPAEEFREQLFALVGEHQEDQMRREVGYPVFHIELRKRSFAKSHRVVNYSDLESSVAETDGEYIAYFHCTKKCSLLKKDSGYLK